MIFFAYFECIHLGNVREQKMLINIIAIVIILFNEMNKQYYDMPLQTGNRRKFASPENIHPYQQYTTPIIHNLKEVHTEDTLFNYKYDLPCQRQNDEYIYMQSQQNRPAILNNAYHEISKYCLTSRTNQAEPPKFTNNQQPHHRDEARARVTSIYERLLQENKSTNRTSKQKYGIVTQATFKPKQLQRELVRHKSAILKKSQKQKNSSCKKLMNSKAQKSSVQTKMLDFAGQAKTKYQQILQQHFNPQFQSKKNNEKVMTSDQIRLSKICGKNSAIMKLKQRLEPMSIAFSSKQKQPKQKLFENCKQQQNPKQALKHNNSVTLQKTVQKKSSTQIQKDEKNIKHSQSERWMSLSFYERQQRVISNRKQKEELGKKSQMQKQIKPCTFKPDLATKSKSQKMLPAQRQSYLQQYYDRLYKKY